MPLDRISSHLTCCSTSTDPTAQGEAAVDVRLFHTLTGGAGITPRVETDMLLPRHKGGAGARCGAARDDACGGLL